jgi:uncharacterized Ntn-hydrolase superfamily protein
MLSPSTSPRRPVHTYSIVARDPVTGDLGCAVQSHWFNVGAIVLWAEPGVGAVATQSFAEPAYGPQGLARMRAGVDAAAALAELTSADAEREVRQVAFVDASGRVAAHTGTGCIEAAGHEVGEGFSVQANMMASEAVWPAMARAYRDGPAEMDLADRLLTALAAAQDAGGDFRGEQSAAILIVGGERTDRSWEATRVDLRVEDHPDPIGELTRLLGLQRAYDLMNDGDGAVATGDWDRALIDYAEAARRAPQIVELPFWHAVALVNGGRTDEALPIFAGVFAREPRWREALGRLVRADQLPDDDALIARITAAR